MLFGFLIILILTFGIVMTVTGYKANTNAENKRRQEELEYLDGLMKNYEEKN